MLYVDQRTYPFVTSSNPVAGGVAVGSGIGPTKINRIVGVSKAYTPRVGDAPLPTELTDDVGEHIRNVGNEDGTTTGCARRVGCVDGVVVRHAQRARGIKELSLATLDVL